MNIIISNASFENTLSFHMSLTTTADKSLSDENQNNENQRKPVIIKKIKIKIKMDTSYNFINLSVYMCLDAAKMLLDGNLD